ncbi:MAG TPA: pantetheine-phosphate adenylyltransferase [Thermoanaerobaculales bacterium]|nr:pantetheine-phosphate adenylyltransferase [Thermoanaerobaculales bacterium]HPA80414.1 pantetheine-phosphate adenylyltransferase [Thermoanaerobaculales bacterium]HQL29580.1 pantetheine-phosphate adenylyltransferase [Thermoanaerobaculales bacterium]HQP44902.1 pantetheine-phosphate adenylyltransferase [Thermoanaerobaculales bacterium]
MSVSHQPVAVFPGSFDPLHLGHADIISRATQIFPRLIVGILENPNKQTVFTPDERLGMVRSLYANDPAVEVRLFSGLLVNFLQQMRATIIIRGMRAVSDFEYEFQMALMNRRLSPAAETVFLTPKEEYSYLSSRLVREVVTLGGDVSGLVPEPIRSLLEERLRR